MTEDPHLTDERVREVELALEPDHRKEGPGRDALEQVDVAHLVDQDVDLEPGLDADGDARLGFDDEDGFVLFGVGIDGSWRNLRTKK